MTKRYVEPGEYVAICNKINFDGHYAVPFTFPAIDELTGKPFQNTLASWYFLNRVNLVACVEAVYPLNIFNGLHSTKLRTIGK